jgi:hypothetical protein
LHRSAANIHRQHGEPTAEWRQHRSAKRRRCSCRSLCQIQGDAAKPEFCDHQQVIGEPLPSKTARQEFHDFMSKSPGEMIKEKLLREIGLTEEEYDALPPEMKAKVDELIAQR